MRRQALLMIPTVLAAACDRSDGSAEDGRRTVHVAADGANGVSVSVPGLDARLSLPGMNLSRHVDLDGMRVAPGTTVRSMDVDGRDGPAGDTVSLAFANPRPPAALIDYYGREAARAGFGGIRTTAATLTASKGARRFALAVRPAGAGSAGTITVTGEE